MIFTARAPRVATPIPGPRSRELLDRQDRRESVARSYPLRIPLALRRGAGSFVQDEDGNVFIDFLSGAGVLALGHGHPVLVAAAQRQLEELAHGLDFPTAVKDRFTDRLLGTLPPGMRADTRFHFCGPTGANAVEAAIKLCKTATGCGEIVAFHGGFHGMTTGALSVSGESALRSSTANQMPGVHFFPYAYCHRCPLGLKPASCETNCACYLERALTGSHGGVGRPAAVLLELVQGEGGTVVPPVEFVQRVRELTARLEIPLIIDEVQTGLGRTGRWYAFEHFGIEPDVLVLSKMLSGMGLPVAVVAYHRRLDAWAPGAHTGTFRGNQPAFAAGAEFIDLVETGHVLANVRERGTQAADRLESVREKHPGLISDVRCLGLMIGVEFADPADRRPMPDVAARVQRAALERGLILEIGGQGNHVIRMLPPLNIDRETMDQAMDIFALAVDDAAAAPLETARGAAR